MIEAVEGVAGGDNFHREIQDEALYSRPAVQQRQFCDAYKADIRSVDLAIEVVLLFTGRYAEFLLAHDRTKQLQ